MNIKTKNNQERTTLLAVLVSYGYTSVVDGERTSDVHEIIEDTCHDTFPIVITDGVEKLIDFSYNGEIFDYTWPEDAGHIIKSISIDNITVPLNDEYDAIVSNEHIEVGCQKISFEVFDKLVEAVNKVRK